MNFLKFQNQNALNFRTTYSTPFGLSMLVDLLSTLEKNSASRPRGSLEGSPRERRRWSTIPSDDDTSDISQSSRSRPSKSAEERFGHTRRDIIALNIDRWLSAKRARKIGRKMPKSVQAPLYLCLFLSLSLFIPSAPPKIRLQSVCPPTPAVLIIGSARLSPSNSSPILLLPQSPASTVHQCLFLPTCLSLSISLFPRHAFERGSHRLLLECLTFVPPVAAR